MGVDNYNHCSLSVEEVTSGQIKISLNYGTIPIINETLDLCDLITQINKRCPLKGDMTINVKESEALPDYLPSVSFVQCHK